MTPLRATRTTVLDAITSGQAAVRDAISGGAQRGTTPRLTRRGWVLVAVVTGLVVLGWEYSPRQINAVAAPALVALVVGLVSVQRAECSAVEMRSPRPGVPGDERTLSVDLDGRGLATVSIDLPDATPLTDDTASTEAAVRLPERIEWTVSLSERGIYDVSTLTVRLHGPLGLVEQRVEETVEAEIVAYPHRFELTEPAAARGELHSRTDVVTQEFDRIREYRPGDPLRRVDWKSSAKHDDLHVIEFADRAGQQAVVIGGVAVRETDDEMARAVATLAEAALDADLDVGVVVPEGRCDPDSGPDHRRRLLRLLARTGPGTISEEYDIAREDISQQEADIVVDASDPLVRERGADPTVRTPYGSYSLGELRSESDTDGDRPEVPA
jgi:uncharacterized protein (DUF58 family)